MGFDDPCFADSEDDMMRTLLDSDHPVPARDFFGRVWIGSTSCGCVCPPKASRSCLSPRAVLAPRPENAISRPKSRLCCRRWNRGGEMRGCSRRYPLELISPKNDDSMNSTFGHREDVDRQTAILRMHAEDAQARGVSNGDRVRVFNDRGSCLSDGGGGRQRWAAVWCAPPRYAGPRANRMAGTSTRSLPNGSRTQAAVRRFIVAWCRWRESETDVG